jgi:hypothetical protein
MLADDREHKRFVEFVVTTSETVPVKPFRGVTVMVECPTSPAFTATVVGLAVNVKSGAFVM